MSAIRALERMLAAGVALETALEIAKAFDDDMANAMAALAREMTREIADAQSDSATSRQARNRRYYETKRLKASEIKTVKTQIKTVKTVSDAFKTDSDGEPRASTRGVSNNNPPPSGDYIPPLDPYGSIHPPPELSLNGHAKPKPNRKPRKDPEFPIPPDWSPDLDERGYAAGLGLSDAEIDRCAVDMRDWALDKQVRRPGWTRTWQRWCREFDDRKKARVGVRSTGPPATSFAQQRDAELAAARERAFATLKAEQNAD